MGQEQLAVDYTPLNRESVKIGEVIGPVRYSISEASRDKTVKFIENSDLEGKTKIDLPYLMPSEMWGFARTLSSSYGRLNEVILAKSRWDVLGRAFPEEELTTTSKILGIPCLRGLPILRVNTVTRNSHGNTVLVSNDSIVMLNGLEEQVYTGEVVNESPPKDSLAQSRREIYFRFPWNEEKWRNNIHTRDYARKFGFKEELPEFVTYMDAISSILMGIRGNEFFDGTRIDLKRILPLYKGDVVDFYVEERDREKSQLVRAFLDGENDERLRANVTLLDP